MTGHDTDFYCSTAYVLNIIYENSNPGVKNVGCYLKGDYVN